MCDLLLGLADPTRCIEAQTLAPKRIDREPLIRAAATPFNSIIFLLVIMSLACGEPRHEPSQLPHSHAQFLCTNFSRFFSVGRVLSWFSLARARAPVGSDHFFRRGGLAQFAACDPNNSLSVRRGGAGRGAQIRSMA